MELVSGSLVPPSDAGGACDLAVAADPDLPTLREAAAALRPGGSCYVEWSTRARDVPRLRRELEAAGLERAVFYHPWPSPADARLWLPLEARGARAFFAGQRPSPSRLRARLRARVLHRLARLRLRLGLPTPVCAVARKAPPAEPGFLHPVRAAWTEWGLGAEPGELSALLLTGGPRSVSKLVGLVFAEPDPTPRLAVKIARTPEAVATLRQEAAVLEALHGVRPGGVRGAPRILHREEGGGRTAVYESSVTGVRISGVLRRGSYRRLALLATDWLAGLAECSRAAPRPDLRREVVEPVVGHFAGSFGAVLDPAMLRRAEEILAGLDDLPTVCEHRDFSPWNVLLTPGGELGVLDWEGATMRGVPALDLVYFLAFLGFYRDGAMHSGRFAESYRRALDPGTLTGGVMRECLARYAGRVGLDPAVLRPLRLLTWMHHARSEHRRFVEDAGGAAPNPGVLRRSRFLRLWEEELRHDPADDRR